MSRVFLCILVVGSFLTTALAQERSDVAQTIRELKSDSRGPFERIAWFCPDGTVRPASERCPGPGGVQRGEYKQVVRDLAAEGIYVGQVLAGQDRVAFLDETNGYARSKQYQIEKYLESVDDGWVMRHARQYRGAIDASNEQAWGRGFLEWLLARDSFVSQHFFFARRLTGDIPYAVSEARSRQIREDAQRLADGMPSFSAISTKILARPDSADAVRVREFRESAGASLPAIADTLLRRLEGALAEEHVILTLDNASRYLPRLSTGSPAYRSVQALRSLPRNDPQAQCRGIADALMSIRGQAVARTPATERITLMELSLSLEDLMLRAAASWEAKSLGDLLRKSATLSRAAAGCGYIDTELWQTLEPDLAVSDMATEESLPSLAGRIRAGREVVERASASLNDVYGEAVELFSSFEPLTADYYDDQVNGSILKPLGVAVGRLMDQLASHAGLTSELVGMEDVESIRGLNPGVAVGELVVIHGRADNFPFEQEKIYALEQAPGNLPPVAGILSGAAANPVSHVQMLLRRLGVPNAAVEKKHLDVLVEHSGRLVFFAVSPGGRVIVKSTWDMTEQERRLFATDDTRLSAETYLSGLDPELPDDVLVALEEPIDRVEE